jgi:hypothetical protein
MDVNKQIWNNVMNTDKRMNSDSVVSVAFTPLSYKLIFTPRIDTTENKYKNVNKYYMALHASFEI